MIVPNTASAQKMVRQSKKVTMKPPARGARIGPIPRTVSSIE